MYDPELRIETARLMLRQPRMAVWRHLMTAVGSWTVMGFGMFSALEWRTGKWLGRVGATMPAASQAVARRLGSVNRGPGRLPAPLEDSVVELWGQTRKQWQVNRLAVGRHCVAKQAMRRGATS